MSTIPFEKLVKVQTIVVHGNCPDGLASAIILDDVLPGREIIFATHKVTKLEPKPNTLFCDIIPPDEVVDAYRDLDAIVLDHHKGFQGSQEKVTRSFKYHAFGDEKAEPGVSGAPLAFRHVWEPLQQEGDFVPHHVRRFATLVGVRDTWVKQHPEWDDACAVAEMLMFYPLSYWIDPAQPPRVLRRGQMEEFERRLQVGRIALKSKREAAERMAKQVFYFTSSRGVKAAVLPGRYVSDAAELVDADFTIGFSFTVESETPKLLLSTRSRQSYDCTAFCQFYGGGGHTKAAGCTVELSLEDPNPYLKIIQMVEAFEASR